MNATCMARAFDGFPGMITNGAAGATISTGGP
jgi:hypothetical protein